MAIYKFLLCWLGFLVVLLAVIIRSGKDFDAQTFGVAILASTVFTAILVALPPLEKATPLDLIGNWLRNFIVFTALIHFALESPRKRSVLSGVSFATILTCLNLLA